MAALSVDGTPMPALPNSADQINYDNTTSGLSATTVKGAVDELASEKQDKTDNSLTTTDKTVVGAVNELKSGLNDLNSNITSYTLAPSTNVTLYGGSCIKVKNTVIVDAIVTFTDNKAKNNSIISGMPAIGNNNTPLYAVMYSNGATTDKYVRVYNNAIMASEDFTSGETIHIMGSYTVTQ